MGVGNVLIFIVSVASSLLVTPRHSVMAVMTSGFEPFIGGPFVVCMLALRKKASG